MEIINLGTYVNFGTLIEKLTYLHTTEKIYSIFFDKNEKIGIYMFYEQYSKKYNFYFKFEDKKVELQFKKLEKENIFSEISNKAEFSELLKSKIDKLIPILKKNGYKLMNKPEISLFELENLSESLSEKMEKEFGMIVEEDEELKKNKAIYNKVVLYHNLTITNIINEPKLNTETNSYKILIDSISPEKIDFFPKQDKLFRDVDFEISAIPNIYFPNIAVITIIKKFNFKSINFEIKYEGQSFSSFLEIVAKTYYDRYKKSFDDRSLNFSLKLLEISKNPYYGGNMTNTTSEDILIKSNCLKCGSSSSIFKVQLSNVKIKTIMGKFESATLFPENIISYKDILGIYCLECGNSIIEDQMLQRSIIRRRSFLTGENWISYETGKPLLDSDIPEEIIVNYDTMNLEVEFDTTNPMMPTMKYNKILTVGKVIGWSDKTGKKSKTFYDRGGV